MSSTEMDMVGVSTVLPFNLHTNHFVLFLQNVLPQILMEGASEDRGEIARLVSQLIQF